MVSALAAVTPAIANEKVVFSRDGQSLAVAHGRDVLVVDVSSGATRRTISVGAQQNGPGGLVFSDDGKTLAIGNVQRRRFSKGQAIEFWPIEETAAPRTVTDEGWAAVMVSDGATIASIGRGFDDAVRLWDWAGGTLLRRVPVAAHFAGEVAIARGAPWVATWSKANRGPVRSAPAPVRLWSRDTGDELASFGSLTEAVIAFAGSQQLATGSVGEIAVWALPSGRKITHVPAFHNGVVRIHATESTLWAVGQQADKARDQSWELQSWSLPTLQPTGCWVLPIAAGDHPDAGRFGFSPDGRLMALYREQVWLPQASPGLALIFDTATGHDVQRVVLPPERIER